MKATLDTIRVVYLDRELQAWGIPYDMRDDVGQTPRHLQAAEEAWRPAPAGHYGQPRPRVTADWMWLGSPGWFGSMSPETIERVKAFRAYLVECGDWPGNPYEWTRLERSE